MMVLILDVGDDCAFTAESHFSCGSVSLSIFSCFYPLRLVTRYVDQTCLRYSVKVSVSAVTIGVSEPRKAVV